MVTSTSTNTDSSSIAAITSDLLGPRNRKQLQLACGLTKARLDRVLPHQLQRRKMREAIQAGDLDRFDVRGNRHQRERVLERMKRVCGGGGCTDVVFRVRIRN